MKPTYGYEALRRFRVSLPHANYFLTMATANRQRSLTTTRVAESIRREILAIESDGHWMTRAVVIMPDHLHLLATLGGTLSLDRAIARFKAKTRTPLLEASLRWQENYYEHRLRETEAIEPVLTYIFLNPYRANLLSEKNTYPWFWLGSQESAWFKPRLDEGKPFPEWLK